MLLKARSQLMTDCGHSKTGSLGLDMLHGLLCSELQIRFMNVLVFSLESEYSRAEFPCKKNNNLKNTF